MTQTSRWTLLTSLLVACVLTGCSGSPPAAESKQPPTSTPATLANTTTPATSTTPTAKPKASEAFCQDLVTLDVAFVKYTADAGSTALGKGEPVPLAELKRVSGVAIDLGRQLVSNAPADIKKDLVLLVKALSESAGHLKPGQSLAKVIEPVYRKATLAAEDRLTKYPGCDP